MSEAEGQGQPVVFALDLVEYATAIEVQATLAQVSSAPALPYYPSKKSNPWRHPSWAELADEPETAANVAAVGDRDLPGRLKCVS
jgi:hypothetical protein